MVIQYVCAQTCNLVVPPNALTAEGLSTPYIYKNCDQTQIAQASFIEAVIVNTKTGALSVYTPLIVNENTLPLLPPVIPNITQDDIIGIWFGSNANVLILENSPNTTSITDANCINGLNVNGVLSPFGQVASCNAILFFNTSNDLINKGILTIPPVNMGINGKRCYTSRHFAIADQDQSDNVVSNYIVFGNQIGQSNAVNKQVFPNATELSNASDNRLLDVFVLPALNCTPFAVPDLVDPGNTRGALALNELQAGFFQENPVALIPIGDPMALVDNMENRDKVNLLRSTVNQCPNKKICTKKYCKNLINVGLVSIVNDQQFTNQSVSPIQGVNLFQFLLNRFNTTIGPNGLNCLNLLNITNPLCTNQNGDINLCTPPNPPQLTTTQITTTPQLTTTSPHQLTPPPPQLTTPPQLTPPPPPPQLTTPPQLQPTPVNFNYIIPNPWNPQLCMCACQFQNPM